MSSAIVDDVPFLTRSQIEERAAEILRQNGLDSIPIDPLTLAKQQGIKVHNARFNDDSIVGMLSKSGEDLTLLVNQFAAPYRKRYTIAHELGHHFLHLSGDGDYVDDEANLFRSSEDSVKQLTSDHRQEIQANMFAVAVLMPEFQVRNEWVNDHSVARLARRFNVSETAMGIRIDQLGLE